jgi:hypothetical protein
MYLLEGWPYNDIVQIAIEVVLKLFIQPLGHLELTRFGCGPF